MKTCRQCKASKPRYEFCKNRALSDGLSLYCRHCSAEKRKAQLAKSKEVKREVVKEKACSKCGHVKPSHDFSLSSESKTGLQSWCNKCKMDLQMSKYEYKTKVDPDGFKTCTKCKALKPVSEFNKCKAGKGGLFPQCRACSLKAKAKSFGSVEAYRKAKAEKSAEWRKRNRAKRNEAERRRKAEDPAVKILYSLRNRINKSVKKGFKSDKTVSLLGCSVKFFMQHLESQFQPGMSWDNYGRDGWHIDHIYPCSAFDLTDPEEQKRCFNYANMQPLWEHDNCRKHASVEKDQKKPLVLSYE